MLTVELDRELVRRGGLYAFQQLAWPEVEPGPYVDGWHIQEICTHLEAVAYNRIQNLIINVPPGCMKSLLTSVFFPVWAWGIVDPTLKWMFASFDASLSRRDAVRAKDLLNSEWFRARWGDKVAVHKGNKADSASEYYTDKGGMRFSTSVGGKATGWHADIQVVDDPIKPKDTKGGSEATGVKLEAAREWWTGTMATRKANPATFRRIIVMQRVHENDLTGVCTSPGSAEKYVHLRLPMEYEQDNPCVTPFGGDRRTQEGELLWEARFPQSQVDTLKDPIVGLGPYDYAAQAQQRPAPKEGGVFKHAKYQLFTEYPPGAQWLQSWDMRFIDSKSRGDFVVGGVWCWERNKYYLVRVYRGRWGLLETITRVKQASEEFPQATLKLVEAKANGHAVVEALKNELAGLVLVEPEGGKEARANAVAPLFEAGNIYLPHPDLGETWVTEFKAELSKFPMGRFDDQVDMATQALLRMKQGAGSRFIAAMIAARQNGA